MNKRLSELTPNEEGKIEKIERIDLACIQRLMTLGFVEGSTVKYVGSAFSGSPIEVLIEGSRISLGSDCASHFLIRT
jgi:Fe2+ transport system protein FeoA